MPPGSSWGVIFRGRPAETEAPSPPPSALEGSAAALPSALHEVLPRLPSILALPMHEYREEDHPVLKLWHACDVIELTLRLVVIIGLADLRRRGLLDKAQKLRRELHEQIDTPTLNRWRAMAVAVTREAAGPEAICPELPDLVHRVLVPLLDGEPRSRAPERSFIALRNQLAHGGGVTRPVGAHLLEVWRGPFEDAVARAAWLADLAFVVRTPKESFAVLRGPRPDPTPYEPDGPVAAELGTAHRGSTALVLVRGSRTLTLWPLSLYGLPRLAEGGALQVQEGDEVAQVYVRRGEVNVQFTPVGSRKICSSDGDPDIRKAFDDLFHPGWLLAEESGAGRAVKGFEPDIRRDAAHVVGRARELALVHATLQKTDSGILWLSGSAGIGKSYLVARVADDLLRDPPARTRVVPFRFHIGDERCSRDSFLAFALAQLRSWEGLAAGAESGDEAEREAEPLTLLRVLLSRRLKPDYRVLFLLDGLDEIAEVDDTFAQEVPLRLVSPRAIWLCAGRPERGLPEAFRDSESCRGLFGPEGLPGMDEGDIRTMLLDMVDKSRVLRQRLLSNDQVKHNHKLFDLEAQYRADLDHSVLPAPAREEFRRQGILLSERAQVSPVVPGVEWVIHDPTWGENRSIKSGPDRLEVHGDQIVNPFIRRVARNAAGLPLYVSYVIKDIHANKLRALDEGELLPPSLAAYHEDMLRRCQLGTLHAILTPMVALIAVAKEPLAEAQLAELVRDHVLPGSDRAVVRQRVREALDRVSSMLRGTPRPGGHGYTLHHHSLRQHMEESETIKDVVLAAREHLCATCRRLPVPADSQLKGYVFRHGVRHLAEGRHYAAAVDLLQELSQRPDLEPDLPRERLRQLAKLVSLGLKSLVDDLRVRAPAEGNRPSLSAADRSALELEARRIVPEKLASALLGFYELEPLKGGIHLLLEFHPDAWPDQCERLLASEDFVVRHAIAEALADIYRDTEQPGQLADIVALTRHGEINHREVGFYALKFVYARKPGLIDSAQLGALAAGPFYTDRMILGELLLNLVLQGCDVYRLVPRERFPVFWQPIWPYNQLDVYDLQAIPYRDQELPEGLADQGVRRAHADLRRTEQLRAELLALPEALLAPHEVKQVKAEDRRVVRELVEQFYALDLQTDRIRAAEPVLEYLLERQRDVLLRVVRLLFAHPLWDVGEAAGTVLSSIAEAKSEALAIIRQLVGDSYWRVRYAAVEAAFGARILDGHASFADAVHRCYADENCRVAGLCAENLTAWVLYTESAEHARIVACFDREIRHWVQQGNDCWLLEHIYHLFQGLHAAREQSGYDFTPLLAAGISPLLQAEQGEREFYELSREEFLRRIEIRQRRRLGLD